MTTIERTRKTMRLTKKIDNILEDYYQEKIDLLEVRKQILVLFDLEDEKKDLYSIEDIHKMMVETEFDTPEIFCLINALKNSEK